MCPVSLFLAIAISDGVLRGVSNSRDLDIVAASSPGWVELAYCLGTTAFPVFRRIGSKLRVLFNIRNKTEGSE